MRQLADLDFEGASRILGLPDAVDPQEPATKAQLDAAVEGISWKVAARVSTQGNINLASPGASIDGITMSNGDRVLVRAQTDESQNGIYVWGGAATAMVRAADASTFAELEGAAVSVQEGTDTGVTYRQTAVNGTIGVDDLLWSTFGTSAPPASESTAGVIEIATQAEANTGTDDARALTPAKAKAATWMVKKFADDFGDASNTQYDITHNLATRDVVVSIYEAASPFEEVGCDITHLDTNTVRVNVAAAPGVDALRIVVLG